MAQCFLFEAMFPAFHVSYFKPQLQQDWAQVSNHGGWIIPAPGSLLGSPHLYWDTQSTSEQVVLGQALCAVRWMAPITDPSPPCGVVAGSTHAGSCSGPTPVQQVLSLSPAKTWAGVRLRPYSRRQADPPVTLHSLVQQWLCESWGDALLWSCCSPSYQVLAETPTACLFRTSLAYLVWFKCSLAVTLEPE